MGDDGIEDKGNGQKVTGAKIEILRGNGTSSLPLCICRPPTVQQQWRLWLGASLLLGVQPSETLTVFSSFSGVFSTLGEGYERALSASMPPGF